MHSRQVSFWLGCTGPKKWEILFHICTDHYYYCYCRQPTNSIARSMHLCDGQKNGLAKENNKRDWWLFVCIVRIYVWRTKIHDDDCTKKLLLHYMRLLVFYRLNSVADWRSNEYVTMDFTMDLRCLFPWYFAPKQSYNISLFLD